MNTLDLKERLKSIQETTGWSQTAIANAIQVSPTTLSQWLAGKYNGNLSKIENEVKNFIEREESKLRNPKTNTAYIATINALKVRETASIAHLDGEICVIYGEAGTGKTTAIKEYTKQHSDAILIEADLGFSSRVLFKKLHFALKLDGQGHIHDLFESVVERLKDSGRVIIIDEAEHLPYRALEMVRRINDFAGVGILLAGMPRLINNLRGERSNYAQLYSRIGIAVKLESLSTEDAEQIVKTYLPGSNGIWKEYFKFSKGNTRTLVKLITMSKRIAQNMATPIDKEVVLKAFEMLIA